MLQSEGYGGYSSAAERLTVAQDVVGSIPTSRPKLKTKYIKTLILPRDFPRRCDTSISRSENIIELRLYRRHRKVCEAGGRRTGHLGIILRVHYRVSRDRGRLASAKASHSIHDCSDLNASECRDS